jgi:hypothetical protein
MAQRISLLGARIKCGADLFEMRMFLKQCHDQKNFVYVSALWLDSFSPAGLALGLLPGPHRDIGLLGDLAAHVYVLLVLGR